MRKLKKFEIWCDESIHESEIINSIMEDLKLEEENDALLESSYDENFSEEDEDFPGEELTWGEKIAFARDFQLLNKAQMAGLFLKALEAFESSHGKYLGTIEGLRNYGKINRLGQFRISLQNLAEALGIKSPYTAARTVNKFKRILSGLESSEEETLYPKILKATEDFKKESPLNLALLVDTIVKKDPSRGIGPKQLAAAVSMKQKVMMVGKKVYSLVKELQKHPLFKEGDKARRSAIKKISQEQNLAEEFVSKAYMDYLSSL
jgi:hypothetical protein